MRNRNIKRNRLIGWLLSYSINLLALAALGLFVVSCSSEEEPSRQDNAQSSAQKEAVKQEAPDQAEEVQQHIKAAVDQIISSKELKIGNTWLAEVSVIPVFYEDIYDRDQAVLKELNAEFQSNQKSAKSE